MYKIKIISFDKTLVKQIDTVLVNLNLSVISLPKKEKKITVLRSIHVNNKSKEHFSIKKFFRYLTINEKKKLKELLKRLPSNISVLIKYSGNSAVW